jgi:hypothetical protein
MQWIPDSYRKNEIRLRYTEKAYKRGMGLGFGLGMLFCYGLFLVYNVLKLVLT